MLHKKFRNNFFVGFIGKWQEYDMGGHQAPIGGLAYYISPPRDLFDIQRDPFHALFYTCFVCGTCAFFARIWIDVSGSSAKDIAKQLMEQDMVLEGGLREESMIKYLNRYINTAATFGGICIGLLSIVADFMGAIGSGTGILLAVTIIYQYFEQISKEKEKGADTLIF